MNFGYLIFVAAHPDIDYLKLAYALALSIKNTQKPEDSLHAKCVLLLLQSPG